MEPAFDLRPLPTDNINGAPLMPRTRKWRTSYYKTLIRSVTGELQPRSQPLAMLSSGCCTVLECVVRRTACLPAEKLDRISAATRHDLQQQVDALYAMIYDSQIARTQPQCRICYFVLASHATWPKGVCPIAQFSDVKKITAAMVDRICRCPCDLTYTPIRSDLFYR